LPHNAFRDWLAIIASGLSALFAGLIYFIARANLTARFELIAGGTVDNNIVKLMVIVDNRSNRRIVVDGMSVIPPLAILCNQAGGHYGNMSTDEQLRTGIRRRQVAARRETEPRKDNSWSVAVYAPDLRSRKKISISLLILTRFPAIRHKKKVLTAILPESTNIKTL
jgi:hypothetical protein